MAAAAKPAVSFIGLGAMGFGMATNLLQKGYPVTGFDVWAPTLERFGQQQAATTAATPADAVASRPFCVVMVATAQQAQAVLFDGDRPAAPALPPGATLLLCSTVPCAFVRALRRRLRPDIRLVDCPVSGGVVRAADGTLSIMAAADDDAALDRARDLLRDMADPRRLYVAPGGVGQGSNLKMVHQVLAANQILAASEALGFAVHLGLDLRKTADAVLASDGRSWMFENRLPRLLAPDFQPVASAVTIILKDAGIITSEARRCGFPTPMTTAAEQFYLLALGRGWGADDDASVLRLYSEGFGRVHVGSSTGGSSPSNSSSGEQEQQQQQQQHKTRLVVRLLEGVHLCAAAETIAFSRHLGLDLDQVLQLCVDAAGGSAALERFGPAMVALARRGEEEEEEAGSGPGQASTTLDEAAKALEAAVDEAQRLRMPLALGSQALNMMRLALRRVGVDEGAGRAPASAAIKAWLP